MSSVCDQLASENQDECHKNVEALTKFTESIGLAGEEAEPIVEQCIPCMITALGGLEGDVCQENDDLTIYGLPDLSSCTALIGRMENFGV